MKHRVTNGGLLPEIGLHGCHGYLVAKPIGERRPPATGAAVVGENVGRDGEQPHPLTSGVLRESVVPTPDLEERLAQEIDGIFADVNASLEVGQQVVHVPAEASAYLYAAIHAHRSQPVEVVTRLTARGSSPLAARWSPSRVVTS